MQLNKHMTAISVTAAMLHSAGTAYAEETDNFLLEEILVTATKREKHIIDIPMSVTAMGQESLERIAADNFEGFVRQIPGVSQNPNGGNGSKLAIRGITTSVQNSNTQAPVAIYHDELPVLDRFAPLVTPDLRLFDVNRVEVLRGPQGTLFGSGALGGAIRVISNKPSLGELEGRINAGVNIIDDGEEAVAFNGMINMPLIEDELALRAVIYSRDGGGYIDNATLGTSDVNSEDSLGGRVMLSWKATEDLSFLLSISVQEDEPEDRAYTSLVGGTNKEFDGPVSQPATIDLQTSNLVVEYDFDSVFLTSSTTFSTRDDRLVADASGLDAIVAPFGLSGITTQNTGTVDTFAQELRLASTSTDTAIEWLVGAFFMDSDRHIIEVATVAGVDAVFATIGLPVVTNPVFPADSSLFASSTGINTTEKALFGELTYNFSDTLSGTVGLRWFDNDQELDVFTEGLLTGGILPPTATESSEDAVTPKFSLSYQPDESTHYYVSVAKGYRIGQSNISLPVVPGFPPPPAAYDADSLWSYELGTKASLLNGDLNVEAAVYFIDWQDIQLQQVYAGLFNYTDNAGEAESKGLELSVDYSLNEHWRLGTSLAYNDAELTSVEVGVDALVGDQLPGAADFKIANYIQWTDKIGANMVANVRLDHQYSSDAYTQLNNATSFETESYSLLNLYVGVKFDQWQLKAYGKNLTDQDRIINVLNTPGTPIAIRSRPREFGVSVDFRF